MSAGNADALVGSFKKGRLNEAEEFEEGKSRRGRRRSQKRHS